MRFTTHSSSPDRSRSGAAETMAVARMQIADAKTFGVIHDHEKKITYESGTVPQAVVDEMVKRNMLPLYPVHDLPAKPE